MEATIEVSGLRKRFEPVTALAGCSIADDARPLRGQLAYFAGERCVMHVSQAHRSLSAAMSTPDLGRGARQDIAL
jgi:hypothetical protein